MRLGLRLDFWALPARQSHQHSRSRIFMEHDPSAWYQGQNLADDRAKFDLLFRWPGFRQGANIPDAGCGFWHVSNCRATALRNRWRCPDRCDTVSSIQSPLDLDRSLPFLKDAEASDCLLRSHVRHVDSSASLARIVRSSAPIRAVEVEMDVFDIPLELLQLVGGKPPFAAIHWER
jgi:hypothetical protein